MVNSKMDERYVQFHERGQGRALIELARQYPPRDAVREFVTNSLDARVPNSIENILVMVLPREKRIVISDDGVGMNYKELTALPMNIGYSKKAGDVDTRGEKALGLLAFGSLGSRMHILSKPDNGDTSNYGYTMWEIDESKERIPFDHRELSENDARRLFYGGFDHGTRVVIDGVNPHVLDKVLTISNLKNWLRMQYTPALRKNIVNIYLGRPDEGKTEIRQELLKEINYERDSSSELVDDALQVPIRNEENPGSLEVLLFVDPEAAYDKVAVYSKDVLVYESLGELPEFSKSPVWTSGKVSGYINDHFNRLILGRAGIDRNRNAFKAWYGAVQELEEQLRPIIEEKKKHGKKIRESEHLKKVFDALHDVWRDVKKTGIGKEYARGSKGELFSVVGVEPTEKRGMNEYETPTPRPETREPTGRPPGPGTFRIDEEGVTQRVVRKSGVPFSYPQPIEFPASESHLRSKLEDLLGSPILFLNATHEDYTSRVDLKDSDVFIRYVAELSAKEAAYYEIRQAEREKRLLGGKDEIANSALQREELIKFLLLRRLGIK